MNGALRPRDAITADMALGSVGLQWDDLYDLNVTRDGQYKATRRQGPPTTVTAPTPGELSKALLADWSSW